MVKGYVPDAGELVWLRFDPQAGREQAGRRPALVLSPRSYNAKARLMIACPITSHAKGYPFEVLLPAGGAVTGVILADHLKSVDWIVREAERIEECSKPVVEETRAKVAALIGV